MRDLVSTVSEELKADRAEAERIIAALLDRPLFELYAMDRISEREHDTISTAVERMKRGVPIEYLTGRVQFRDHVLSIHPGVFIPRLETEYLVELIQKELQRAPGTILEIGTGCGALSVALALIYPDSRIVATDISRVAIENARQNIKNFRLASRIHIVQCDIYDGITGSFDLIVSNPPYVPRARLKILPNSVKNFEPITALDGGEEGVDLVQKLIEGCGSRLSNGGLMAIEIDEEAVKIIELMLRKQGFYSFRFHKDLFGRWRYLFIGGHDEKG